jgi:hypothetical protein
LGGKLALIGSASPINISNERLKQELAGPAGEYLAKMGWSRDDIASLLVSGRPHTWTPDVLREDRDVNTDIFPKDEYYRNNRKIDLIAEDQTPNDLTLGRASVTAR